MSDKESFKIPDLFQNHMEKLQKLKHQNVNQLPSFKRNCLSSKINNNNDAKINMAKFIDINKKAQKIPENIFGLRSIRLNKPDSRFSRARLNSREMQNNHNNNLMINQNSPNQQLFQPPNLKVVNSANSANSQIANFPSQNKQENDQINNIHNIHNIKFENYHIVNDENSNQLFSSFKNLNHGYHSNNSKIQPVNQLKRNIFSGNSNLKGNQKIANDKLKIINFKNIFSNSISINHLVINKPNLNNENINAKKPNTTTKLEMTSNFFFGGSSCVKEFAYKEEQNSGNRKTMEDYTKIIDNFQGEKNKLFFGVFDGHGGGEVARIAKEKLPDILANILSDSKFTIENALTTSFKKTDDEFKIYENVGTTACIIYITNEKDKRVIFSANVGDSRTVLVKNKEAKRLSYDHKCSDVKENERIKHSGGIIFGGRVFGQLALTRAFGDFGLKNYGVCPIPYISKTIIEDDDKYIVMGSDGIWDVIDEDLVYTLSLNIKNADEFCKILVKNALSLGSTDNISCIVVKLN